MNGYCTNFKIMFFLIFLFGFLGLGKSSLAATYYISANGNDNDPGTQAKPWQSLWKVTSTPFAPGDTVLFNRGDAFAGNLTPATCGTAGNPISFGAYGSGSRPVIDASGQIAGISIYSKAYLIFQDLEIRNGDTYGIWFVYGNNNMTVNGVKLSNNGRNGMHIADYGASGGMVVNSNFVIKNSIVDHNSGSGLAVGSLANTLIQGNITTYNCQSLTCGDSCTYCGGIRLTNTTSENTIIENNESAYNTNGAGIWVDFNAPGEIVRYNKVHHNVVGIYNEITSGSLIYGNVSYDNGTGIWVSGREGGPPYNGPAIGNKVLNNTVYHNSSWGILLQNDDGIQGNCTDNVIQNNIVWGTTVGPNLRVGGAAENEHNIIEHNSFGAEVTNMFEIGWGVYQSTYTSLNSWYGQSTNSIKANSIFVNYAGGDLSLTSSSPGINAGFNLGTPFNLSLSNTTVWPNSISLVDRGSAWDIGAYEYVPSGNTTPPAAPTGLSVN